MDPPNADPSPKERILVVDDSEANREVLEESLADAGYEVTQADGGEGALASFGAARPDLVLLDVLMPGIDGFETCRRLRALPGGGETPIVFLTALSDFETHRKALSTGADDFLVKPVNRTEVLIRVRSLLWTKKLNEDLRRSNEVIRSQRDALQRAQEQTAELLALVVHDLKNPLASILLGARLVEEDANLSSRSKKTLGRLVQAVQSMNRMVMNLLDLNRVEEGALNLNLEDVDLEGLVSAAATSIADRAEARKQKIVLELDGRKKLRLDADLVRRLVENLLDNALKYAPQGSRIILEVRGTDLGAEIRVRDQGPGIPPAQRERIFEKYVQLEVGRGGDTPHRGPSGDTPHPGPGDDAKKNSRGLGLRFCRIAAEAHGGRIWVEDNTPRGAVFCVQLPGTVSGAGAGDGT